MSQLADKLKSVYAAIDDGQFEKAVRLCGRKDIERYDMTRTLLAYSLQKLRQNSDALQIARQVLARKPTDDAVVSTLATTLQALRADDDLQSLREGIFEADPTNEGAGIELFLFYTRIGFAFFSSPDNLLVHACNFFKSYFLSHRFSEAKKMQLLGQRLYKQTSNCRYVFWTVASMLLQLSSTALASDATLLSLAERMVKKSLENSVERLGAQELELFIDILVRQSKVVEAIESLEALQARPSGPPINDEDIFREFPSTVQIHPLSLLELKIDLLDKAGRPSDVQDGETCIVF